MIIPDELKQKLLSLRRSLLMGVDIVERILGISPTTAEIRAAFKHSPYYEGDLSE